jgi:hypothetical protein
MQEMLTRLMNKHSQTKHLKKVKDLVSISLEFLLTDVEEERSRNSLVE